MDDLDLPTGRRLENRKLWEVERARGKRSETDVPSDFSPIIFPPASGLRHAAMVVCGAHVDRPNGIAEAREICLALGIPQILAEGGDGRRVKREGRVKIDPDDLPPLGFDENDVGRPTTKKGRT